MICSESVTLGLGLLQRLGFPGGSDCKVSARDAGDPGLILGLGRSPGEGNPLQAQFSSSFFFRHNFPLWRMGNVRVVVELSALRPTIFNRKKNNIRKEINSLAHIMVHCVEAEI